MDNLQSELKKDFKEFFFGTPIWKLDNDSFSNQDISTLKRQLYKPSTPYGLGKVIELSLYPKNWLSHSFRIPQNKKDTLLPHLETLNDQTSRILLEDETSDKTSKLTLSLKSSAVTPSSATDLLIRATNIWCEFNDEELLRSQLFLTQKELKKLRENTKGTNLLYMQGVDLEAFITEN